MNCADDNKGMCHSQAYEVTSATNEDVVKTLGIKSLSKLVLPSAAEILFDESFDANLCEMERERKLVGIRNTNLTCYINAVIQLIFNCKR